ncbi:hypothetical protein AWB65_04871 [Caballeronia humi]|uniref:Uncharacterized protein n=1 Tax=Caballeronia humi TaxID=326474 RepID=A0A158IIB7_9BURK|nr:hypothetical protein AWB65_04871 [Caballeronia humi]
MPHWGEWAHPATGVSTIYGPTPRESSQKVLDLLNGCNTMLLLGFLAFQACVETLNRVMR